MTLGYLPRRNLGILLRLVGWELGTISDLDNQDEVRRQARADAMTESLSRDTV